MILKASGYKNTPSIYTYRRSMFSYVKTHGLYYQSFCDHRMNFAQVNIWKIVRNVWENWLSVQHYKISSLKHFFLQNLRFTFATEILTVITETTLIV
jgi:hypothetical protein